MWWLSKPRRYSSHSASARPVRPVPRDFSKGEEVVFSGCPNAGFSDVPVTHPFYKEIATAVNAGWFKRCFFSAKQSAEAY